MRIYPCRHSALACFGLVTLLLGGSCVRQAISPDLTEKDNSVPTEGLKTTATDPYPLSEDYPSPAHFVEVLPYPGPNQTNPTLELPVLLTPAIPPGLPTISPSWATYTHPTLPIQLSYPPDWSGSTGRYEGSDGFFEIRVLTGPPSVFHQNRTFDKIGTLCVLEANGPKSGIYGAFPPIIDWREERQSYGMGMLRCFRSHSCMAVWSWRHGVTACSRAANPSCSLAFLLPGQPIRCSSSAPTPLTLKAFLAVESDRVYTAGRERSIFQFTRLPGSTRGRADSRSSFAGLVITETALAKADCDPWANYDDFQARAEQANQSRSDFKQQGVRLQMEVNNQALAPFGFRLEEATYEHYSYPMFALYQGETVLVDYIIRFWPVTINAAGDDFLLWLGVRCGEPSIVPVEVRRDGVRQIVTSVQGVWNPEGTAFGLASKCSATRPGRIGSNHWRTNPGLAEYSQTWR